MFIVRILYAMIMSFCFFVLEIICIIYYQQRRFRAMPTISMQRPNTSLSIWILLLIPIYLLLFFYWQQLNEKSNHLFHRIVPAPFLSSFRVKAFIVIARFFFFSSLVAVVVCLILRFISSLINTTRAIALSIPSNPSKFNGLHDV